ncbi:heterogeneous nuclear ribonucleoproteins A2/B1-like isoform X1 [Aphis gossypii]|uniref:heterogeneous nuclear ribonucleoproteins A2/B1-like isoform X1 n=2 Tax=Aphis gossypii TaxID=80765 RepID=UPI002158C344|nr:heterogeneous nuclear ribonucleoproteins A2/B1-like isoform X1 [Aphis gossypii]
MEANKGETSRHLFIGALSKQTTDQSFRQFFEQWGEVERAVVIKYPQSNRSRKFGFITYSQSHMADLALSNLPHRIDDHNVDTKIDEIRAEREKQNRLLYVWDLDKHTTSQSLKNFYEQWGKVESAVVKRDSQSNESREFGFVTYSQLSMVQQAMSNLPHIIDGREVQIRIAQFPSKFNYLKRAFDENKIYITGITNQSKAELIEYFEKFGKIMYLKTLTNKYTGKMNGIGFVEYDSKDSVGKALSIEGHQIGSGILYTEKAFRRKIYDPREQRPTEKSYSRYNLGINFQNNQWGGFYNKINAFYSFYPFYPFYPIYPI